MMQYGDEIGMGDDLRLPERECARTPMQWTSERHGGFSTRAPCRPTGDQRPGLRLRARQRRRTAARPGLAAELDRADDPDAAASVPEISWGDFAVLRTNAPEVLALRYDWRDTSLVTLHNFANRTRKVELRVERARDETLVEIFDGRHSRMRNDGTHVITMEPYALALVPRRRRPTTRCTGPISTSRRTTRSAERGRPVQQDRPYVA